MRLLLIDTCGAEGSVALAEDDRIVAMEILAAREASVALLPAIDRLLAGRRLTELDAVGVVNGPGSFTGVRVGVAAAMGLCEGAGLDSGSGLNPGSGLRLVTVSRLAVLADVACLVNGVAVLDAGRGDLYVRDAAGRERLVSREDFSVAQGTEVAVAEAKVFEALQSMGATMFVLNAGSALGCVRRAMTTECGDALPVDANYVRSEETIYAAKICARANGQHGDAG